MTIVELRPLAVAAVALAAACGAAAEAVTGFGFSLVTVPVLVLLVGPAHAVRLVNVLAVGVNLLLLAREHRQLHATKAMVLLLPAAVVTPGAAYLVHRTDPPVLSVVVGVTIIACAVVLVSGRRARRLRGRRGLVAAGGLSAAMNTASGVGGPAVAMYAINAGWPIEMTRPTLQVYFLGLNIMSFVALGPVARRGVPSVVVGIAVVSGFGAGGMLLRRLTARTVGHTVLALAVAGGAAAVLRGVLTG